MGQYLRNKLIFLPAQSISQCFLIHLLMVQSSPLHLAKAHPFTQSQGACALQDGKKKVLRGESTKGFAMKPGLQLSRTHHRHINASLHLRVKLKPALQQHPSPLPDTKSPARSPAFGQPNTISTLLEPPLWDMEPSSMECHKRSTFNRGFLFTVSQGGKESKEKAWFNKLQLCLFLSQSHRGSRTFYLQLGSPDSASPLHHNPSLECALSPPSSSQHLSYSPQ